MTTQEDRNNVQRTMRKSRLARTLITILALVSVVFLTRHWRYNDALIATIITAVTLWVALGFIFRLEPVFQKRWWRS